MNTIIALILSVPALYYLPRVPFVGKILTGLGINQTAPVMVVFFAIAYFFLNNFLIKPYEKNLEYRKKNTGGSLDEAATLNSQTEGLASEYQIKMKKQNEAAQGIYEKIKKEGMEEEDRLIAGARKLGSDLVDQAKKKVSTELLAAKESLKSQIPQLSELIASRVLGRDIS